MISTLRMFLLLTTLALACADDAAAFTHSCIYGPPPAGTPPDLSNPAVYGRLDWTTSENATANGVRMFSRAWDPTNTYLGELRLYVPTPQPSPGWWIHAVAWGSPIPAGEYRVYSEASAYVFIFFEGAYWPVDIGFFSSCLRAGNIP